MSEKERDWGICPKCKKPTKVQGGVGMSTCVDYPPIYDEEGNNTNPDMNTTTYNYKCLECKTWFSESFRGGQKNIKNG